MTAPHPLRITLVHQAALGDTLLLIPLLQSLQTQWSQAQITLVTWPAFGALLKHLGHIHAWSSADSAEHTAWFGPYDPTLPHAPPAWAKCDLLISAVSDGRDHWADHARAVLAGRADCLHFFQPRPPADFHDHVTAWHRAQLAALELQQPVLPALFSNPNGPIFIHPGSGGAAKCWPTDRFIQLARRISSCGSRVEFILGEAELERWPRETLAQISREFTCHHALSLIELSCLLRTARAWIGNDSGPTHLAAAMGLPGVSLFGPSNDIHWRPIGHMRVVRAKPPRLHDLVSLSVDELMDYLKQNFDIPIFLM